MLTSLGSWLFCIWKSVLSCLSTVFEIYFHTFFAVLLLNFLRFFAQICDIFCIYIWVASWFSRSKNSLLATTYIPPVFPSFFFFSCPIGSRYSQLAKTRPLQRALQAQSSFDMRPSRVDEFSKGNVAPRRASAAAASQPALGSSTIPPAAAAPVNQMAHFFQSKQSCRERQNYLHSTKVGEYRVEASGSWLTWIAMHTYLTSNHQIILIVLEV